MGEVRLVPLHLGEDVLMDGDPRLRMRSVEIASFDEDIAQLVSRMIDIMRERNGCGLAAIQIGFPLRVVVARVADVVEFMVNPVIIRTLRRESTEREGCLSVPPRLWRPVSRPAKCDIRWQNLVGETHVGSFAGEMARILQHEIDHLDGILITDKPLP